MVSVKTNLLNNAQVLYQDTTLYCIKENIITYEFSKQIMLVMRIEKEIIADIDNCKRKYPHRSMDQAKLFEKLCLLYLRETKLEQAYEAAQKYTFYAFVNDTPYIGFPLYQYFGNLILNYFNRVDSLITPHPFGQATLARSPHFGA